MYDVPFLLLRMNSTHEFLATIINSYICGDEGGVAVLSELSYIGTKVECADPKVGCPPRTSKTLTAIQEDAYALAALIR